MKLSAWARLAGVTEAEARAAAAEACQAEKSASFVPGPATLAVREKLLAAVVRQAGVSDVEWGRVPESAKAAMVGRSNVVPFVGKSARPGLSKAARVEVVKAALASPMVKALMADVVKDAQKAAAAEAVKAMREVYEPFLVGMHERIEMVEKMAGASPLEGRRRAGRPSAVQVQALEVARLAKQASDPSLTVADRATYRQQLREAELYLRGLEDGGRS